MTICETLFIYNVDKSFFKIGYKIQLESVISFITGALVRSFIYNTSANHVSDKLNYKLNKYHSQTSN